jgi:hypothetical protein
LAFSDPARIGALVLADSAGLGRMVNPKSYGDDSTKTPFAASNAKCMGRARRGRRIEITRRLISFLRFAAKVVGIIPAT